VSVDTYLQHKNTSSGYQVVNQEGIQLLVAFSLARWAKAVHLDVSKLLFGTRFAIDAEPKQSHSHGPT